MTKLVQNLDPIVAAAKGKGCSTSIAFAAPEREIKVFMGGVGVASVTRNFDVQPASMVELDRKPIASMEWLSNQMFGHDDNLGEIHARFKVLPEGKNRSTALVMPQSSGTLLPARIINSLFVDIKIPALNLRMENRDALVLRADSVAMGREVLMADARFRAYPAGTPQYERYLIDGGVPSRFLAAGTHTQVEPIQMFQPSDSFLPVARLEKAEVMVLPHYGVEVELVEGNLLPESWSATLKVSNLLERKLDLRWFCDPLNRMQLRGRRSGRLLLRSSAAKTINLRGALKAPAESLNALDTVMFSICNVARGPEDFVSGYIALTVSNSQ
ncbi:hypothetical protein [Hydrogenophaga luteola]|uniref:Uncharacterized protein n=1 Tax=Hydrogenophaga luteola TaxID=1591122 RepID=A0ABV7W945_9BURK